MLLRRATAVLVLAAGATLPFAGVANAQDIRNCDFTSQAEAQTFFESIPGDPNHLDADNDGIACENLPGPSRVPAPATNGLPGAPNQDGQVSNLPVGSVNTGDGSTADDSNTVAPVLIGLVGLGAAAMTAAAAIRRGRRTN